MHAVDGKIFIINGFNIELDTQTEEISVLRQGTSNVVKFVNNQNPIIQTIMVDFDKLKADQQMAPLNVTLIGACQKLN